MERALTHRLIRLLVVPVALAWALPLAGQVRAGDAAWEAGDFAGASRAYHVALADDPASVRSLYRLGLLASWDNRLDSALTLLSRARTIDPEDPDVRYAEALVRSWDGQYGMAIAQFDSLLARHPDRLDAAVARANTLAWSGRHEAASLEYEAVLATDPGRVDALTGLGRLQLWQGRADLAEARAREALARDPADRDARQLLREVHSATRPYLDFELGWSEDSDDNVLWWQHVAADVPMSHRVRALGRVGLGQASDPVREGTRSFAEVGARWHAAAFTFTAMGGMRTLNPEGTPGRTAGTARGLVTWRPSSRVLLGLGAAAYPFDETAFLLTQDIDVVDVDASVAVELTHSLDLGIGASAGWLTDDNSRWSATMSLMQDLPAGFFAGGYARRLQYDEPGIGYFSPDEYSLLEARAGWHRDRGRWTGRVMVGVGAQWIATGAAAQSEWRVEANVGHQVATDGRLELFGAYTDAAVSSTTGAYGYGMAGIRLRLGL